ncbi:MULTISPECIES: TlyA family RNA methyltransferase [unclassified Paenibacillus]|uniref:TlyA family RNA methyltransferase n=1 Tax=unclassified Paenibacillus TaxID=185978 RepID=UPI001AE8328E|nr:MULTISPECIES: TlyA family RNA methyltransferase [unclassified Paenibacillus]MBP1155144.1 23S rRNA (cytidine1920-2'-O)/16S rRNA (cytidine1409-2'-O)-methyltransferase [Paenibacillus sp. PvP091]MBP1169472.1 23S rRNA (cytidine1920-2'-O)/16S rRNA (cytidine1409-2'-O)-methyltransferase [Paenibacillus sp. PvR098]MBP2440500.1 23S rRNA (cytidine1920-2'-O)/16S rRNA (cytidine1409-2'-O)-methyltransferase [Paenibacillus sp. PvP052]
MAADKADKERLDLLLVELGLYETREKAKSAIMAGLVLVDDEPVDKAGTKIPRASKIVVKGAVHPYVSRGGLKLEKALCTFGIDLQGVIMLDIGASTGGFTDCALQNGAAHVYAVDVGYNQLDWSLRKDPRVSVMERTNFRYMQPEVLKGPQPSFASIDVSFISLKLILPPLKKLLSPSGQVVALVKPQFEAGREKVGKSGVVREPETHREVLQTVLQFAQEIGFAVKGVTYSPIKGGEGNIEFLAYLTQSYTNEPGWSGSELERRIREVVEESQSMQSSS